MPNKTYKSKDARKMTVQQQMNNKKKAQTLSHF